MLGMRPDRTESSRLSCQIQVTEDMEGMVVQTPRIPDVALAEAKR